MQGMHTGVVAAIAAALLFIYAAYGGMYISIALLWLWGETIIVLQPAQTS